MNSSRVGAHCASGNERYREKAVIWVLGGDRDPETETHFEIIR